MEAHLNPSAPWRPTEPLPQREANAPVVLGPLTAPAAVTSPEDRIHCEPYRVKLSAGACSKRHLAVSATNQKRGGERLRIDGHISARADCALCVNCAIGATVRERLSS